MQGPYTFGPVMLTSLERVAFYLGKDVGNGRVNGINSDTDEQRRARRSIMQWILDVSSMLQNYCNREFLIQSRIQFFDVMQSRMEFFPAAVPILSITELSNDPLGQFIGGESVVDAANYRINSSARSFETVFTMLLYGRNALRGTYVGGLAYHGTQTTATLSGVTGAGSIITGRYAYGATGEAIGKVASYDDTTKKIVLESMQGVFLPLEALTFSAALHAQDIAATGATVASIDRQSLVEAFPDIARAIDIEIRFMEKHENDYENQTDGGKYGATHRMRPTTSDQRLTLQEETIARLAPYVRYITGS